MFKTPKVPSKRQRRIVVVKKPKAPKPELGFFDLVDDKVLMAICRHLSGDDLKAVKLVCKKFYKVVIKTFPGKTWLWLKNETYIEDESLYNDMNTSSREIVNFAVGESDQISPVTCLHNDDDFVDDKWYFLRVQSIIGIHYRNNINQIQLMNLDMSVSNLLRFLSFPADFHTLSLFFVSQFNDKPETVKIPPDALPFIENVIAVDCGEKVLKMMTYLQPDSLKSFTVKVSHFKHLEAALKHQSIIFKLSLNCFEAFPIPNNLYEGKKFTSLTLNVATLENLPQFLVQFVETLQFLNVSSMLINSDTFKAITDLSNLKRLIVDLSDVSCGILIKIIKLKKLSSLTISGGGSVHLEVLLSLQLFNLEFFDFPNCDLQEARLVAMRKDPNNNDVDMAG